MPYYITVTKIKWKMKTGSHWTRNSSKNSILRVENAVEYLQKHHLAYNDIKPDNVFVDKWGCAHLGDFGLAGRGSLQNGQRDRDNTRLAP
ncbi:serine/threonine-protein kinase 32B [Elysia marginata]|uniref:Serine/threonine-protein kinase 32B n=1 Tax=Elysia marginata TaxID=1093978 RepID=A0AAV4HRK1_9GAST|nr:serine/threonine-protein kinase 32B [Elysia marginata]